MYILNGAAVTWSSRRQQIVALSTMESEYIAASDSTREAVWLRRLLEDLNTTQTEGLNNLNDASKRFEFHPPTVPLYQETGSY